MTTQQIAVEALSRAPPLETIAPAQDRIVEEFSLFDDWSDRYQNLIEFGGRLSPMPSKQGGVRARPGEQIAPGVLISSEK